MGWPSAALGDLAEIERDSVAPESIRSGTRYVGLEHIASSGEFLCPPEVDAGELASSKFAFTSEHLLYGKLRPYLSKIARPDFSGVCSTDILPIRPGPSLDRDFLHHYLRLPNMVKLANSRAAGANLPRLSPGVLAGFAVPLPPLPEQRRIAEVLDRAETLRAQRRQALAQLDAFAEASFLALFQGRDASHWPRVPIGAIATKMRTGPFGSQLLHSEFVESGVAVLGIDNVVQNEFVWAQPRFITASKFKQLERYRVAPGDVLVTIMGTCGRCAIVPEDMPVAINTKHLCCITLDQDRCLPSYLQAALLQHPEALHQLGVHERGAVMPGLNMQLIRDLVIPLPPLPIQGSLRSALAAVSSQKQMFERSLTHLDILFTSLQHRAFRGEL